MHCLQDVERLLVHLLVLTGCLLAVVTAFEPQATGAWHLVAAWMMCGLIPYIVYGSITTILDGCTLLTAGLVLLTADLVARYGLGLTAAAQPDLQAPVWLSTVLVLAVLPAGTLVGTWLSRLPACRRSANL
ncbi:MAG: hypothetical protein WBQ78_05455 [Gammaproteobacteria bacterium]